MDSVVFAFEFPDSRFKNMFSKVVKAWLVYTLLKQIHRCARGTTKQSSGCYVWALKV